MNKFVFKYTLIFALLISLMFFSLVFFNEYQTDKMHAELMKDTSKTEYQLPPIPDPPKQPPLLPPLLSIVLVSSTFSFIILKYINKNFVNPLVDIENNIKNIKDGNLDVLFKTKSHNKNVIETIATLNNMVEGLKQKEKLREEFIRGLVHDLRAPVVAQERAMEILNEEVSDNELVKGLIENNDTYLKLINNIIDVFSQKEIKIDKTVFNFSKLASDIISTLEPLAKEKNITFVREIDEDFNVWSDYISLNRILSNLIYNAIENIGEGKVITIKAVEGVSSDMVIIQDNGQGISEEQIKTIFEKHIIRGNRQNKLISGIGLSVVNDLVKKNQGKIMVESEENSYTKFTIELPRKI